MVHIDDTFERDLINIAIVTVDAAPDDEVDRAVKDVLRLTREHLSMDVAFVSHFAKGHRTFKAVVPDDGKQVISVGGSDPLESSFCQRVIDGRLPEMVKDVAKLPTFSELPVTPFKIGAHLSTAIRLENGTVYGTLCTFSFAPNQALQDRDHKRLRMAASMVARLIDAAQRREHGRGSGWGMVED